MKCECLWSDFVFWKLVLLIGNELSLEGFLGWPCGSLERHNVTREGAPQGGDGWLGRRRVIRRGRPSPSCGGDWRKSELRECAPQVHWESDSSEQFLCCCCLLFSFVYDYCWIVLLGILYHSLEYLFMLIIEYLRPWFGVLIHVLDSLLLVFLIY